MSQAVQVAKFIGKATSNELVVNRDERGTQRLPVKTYCFARFGPNCALGNGKKWDEEHMQTYICQNAPYFAVWNQVRMSKSEKMGRKTQRLHSPVKVKCFVQFGIISREAEKNGTGHRQEAFTSEKAKVLRSLE